MTPRRVELGELAVDVDALGRQQLRQLAAAELAAEHGGDLRRRAWPRRRAGRGAPRSPRARVPGMRISSTGRVSCDAAVVAR